MKKANQDIRQIAKQAGVCLWQVAEYMGVCDMTLSRRLRKELPDSEKQRIIEIINLLKLSNELSTEG